MRKKRVTFVLNVIKFKPMFIRKKLNKGGSISVLLIKGVRKIGKKHSTPIIIKNFGTARNKKDIAVLIKEAEEYKANLEAKYPQAKTLKIASDMDIKSCRSFNVGISDVYGAAFDEIFSKLEIKPNLMKGLRDLAVMRVAAPASKLKTTQISTEYGIEYKVDCIYKMMDKVTKPCIDAIKKAVYDHTTKLLAEQDRTVDVLFYDLTTVYFETGTQDEIRDFGFSKDGKHQHVQIMLAAIATTEGLLIDYQEFPGNFYEGHTLIPALNQISARYNIGKVILVADAALMNKINLQELDAREIKYIIAARIKNTSKEIKNEILDISGYNSIGQTIDVDGAIQEEVKAKIIDSGEGDWLIAYHSTKRARKDGHDREKDLEKIKKYINSTAKSKLTGKLKKSYVKVSKGCRIEIDYEKLATEKQYDGYFGLRTNIENASPANFLSSYRGLWQIEQTFRISKTNLEIRPVFHYNPQRIKAHFAICYMALALIRHVEYRLKTRGHYIPFEQLHILLDKMRKVQIVNSQNELFEFFEDPPLDLIPVYHALKIKWPKKFGYTTIL
jgi:transposase